MSSIPSVSYGRLAVITISTLQTHLQGMTKQNRLHAISMQPVCLLLRQRSVMRIRQQLEHLPVDDDEAPQLPDRVGAHVAREAGRHGRIVGLLVGLAVGLVV